MKIVSPLPSTASCHFPSPSTNLKLNPTMFTHLRRRNHRAPPRQPPDLTADQRHPPKKRKHFHENETLTLNRCSSRYCSSSRRFESRGHSSNNVKKVKRNSKDDVVVSRHGGRKWTYSDHDCSGFTDKLVIVSYNILGVQNASNHPHLYRNTPHKYVDWDHRRELIWKELNQYDPSIMCFQEVDRFSDLYDALRHDGFRGVLKARTGGACDGCAIFWKDKRFTLLHEENIEFQRFGLRDNVAQFCVLKMNEDQLDSDSVMPKSKVATSRSLVVGNTHVLFSPKRGDIKLGQVRLFLEKAHRLSKEWGGIPVVLAGDLNSVPQSAIYQFISSAELDILQHDRRNVSGQIDLPLHYRTFPSSIEEPFRQSPSRYRWSNEDLKLAAGNEGVTCLQHQLELCSAYAGVPGNRITRDNMGEPLATSYHSKFLGTVDYIWHSEALVPVRVLETLPLNMLRNMGGLPNEKWGSDHLALVCEFAFADSDDSTCEDSC